MKRIFTIVAVIAVLVSVEAKAQMLIYNPVAAAGTATDEGTAPAEDGTAVVNPYAAMQDQMIRQQYLYQQLFLNKQYNYALENLDSPANQKELKEGLESDLRTATHTRMGQNAIMDNQVDEAVRRKVTCNPYTNMTVNPACMGIDVGNSMQNLQLEQAYLIQMDRAVFANFI